MPAHNVERYVAEAIACVLNQSYPRFEVIVVDDASTDRTAEIVAAFDDRRIRLFRNSIDRGVAASRNIALDHARGDFMAILEAEDVWHKERLSKVVEIARMHPQAVIADDLVICLSQQNGGLKPLYNQFFKVGLKFQQPVFKLAPSTFIRLQMGLKPLIPSSIIRDHGLRFTEGTAYGEDFEFWMELFRLGYPLYLLNEALYYYRVRPGSLSRDPDRARSLISVCNRLLAKEGFDESTRVALKRKLRESVLLIDDIPFATAFKEQRFSCKLSQAIHSPRVVCELFRVLPRLSIDRASLCSFPNYQP